MNKKLITLAVAGALTSPLAAVAEDSPHSVAYNVGIVSDYLFRGISQTHGDAALQGGVDYSHSSGLYAGVWGSTISWVDDAYGSGTTEIDFYGGYKGSLATDLGYDVGLIHYNYPSHGNPIAGTNANPNTTEVYGAISYKWVTLKYSHAISSHFVGWLGNNGNTDTKGSGYLELNAAYDLGDGWGITGHVGHQKVKNVVDTGAITDADYTDWKIGVTKDVGFGVVGLAYSDTDTSGTCASTGGTNAYCWTTWGSATSFKDVSKGTAVLSFTKSF
ncbi:MAG: TorF family putative porin [Pseudomonadota bacterium]